MPSRPWSASTWSGRDVVDEVDLALDQRLDRGVLALEDPERHPVDVRGAVPVVGVGLEHVRRAAGRSLHEPERSGPDHGLAVGGLVAVGLHVVLGHVGPDVLGQDRDRQQRQHGVRPGELEHHGRVVGSGDGLHRGQVGAPVAGLGTAVEDPVVGVGDVGRGQRLAVGPVDPLADVEGPGQAVLGGLPRRRERRRRRHVLHRVADHVVVHQRPHLVRRRLVAVERVERVDLVEEGDGERHLLVVRGARRRAPRAPGRRAAVAASASAATSRGGATVPCMTTPRPSRRRRPRAARTSTPSTACAAPTRTTGCATSTPPTSSPTSRPNGPGTTLLPDIWTPSSRRCVPRCRRGSPPLTGQSVGVSGDCSYYTVLAEGREHPQLFRDRHLPVTEDSVPTRPSCSWTRTCSTPAPGTSSSA